MSEQAERPTTEQAAQDAPIVYDPDAARAARGFARFALALAREGVPRDIAFRLAAYWLEHKTGYEVPPAPPADEAPGVPPLWMAASLPARRARPGDPAKQAAGDAMMGAVAATWGGFYRAAREATGTGARAEDEAIELLDAYVRRSIAVWEHIAKADAALDPSHRRANAIWDAALRGGD